MIRLQEESGELFLDPEYSSLAEENEKRMLENAEKLASQLEN